MKRYCLALDLKNDPQLIEEYKKHHRAVWPEVLEAIRDSGINELEIYHVGDRLFMIMETQDDFSFIQQAQMDQENPKIQEWESLMWKYQQALPVAKDGVKWVLMNKIFDLTAQS